jgi:hypothetical protein
MRVMRQPLSDLYSLDRAEVAEAQEWGHSEKGDKVIDELLRQWTNNFGSGRRKENKDMRSDVDSAVEKTETLSDE